MWDFPHSSVGKESTCNAGDLGSIPGLGRSPGDGKGYQLQYSGLENSMDYIVHGGHKQLDTTEQLCHPLSKVVEYPCLSCDRLGFNSLMGKQHALWASLVAQLVKKYAYMAGNLGSVPGLGRSPGKGNGYPLQYSVPENSMDRGAWRGTVHGIAKSWT